MRVPRTEVKSMAHKQKTAWRQIVVPFSSNTGITRVVLLDEATIDDELVRVTILRVEGRLRVRNGSAGAANTIVCGLLVENGAMTEANLPSPVTDDWSEGQFMWMDSFASNVVDEAQDTPGWKVSTRTKRVLRSGHELILVYDDTDNDFDILGGQIRMLVQLS